MNESLGEQDSAAPASESSASEAPIDSRATPAEERARSTLTTDRDYGDWWLLEELGRGRSGVVYKALERKRHRVVAIKTIRLDPSAPATDAAACERVARNLQRLHHRHVPELYASGRRGDEFYFATAFAGGRSLRSTLAISGPMPGGRAAELFCRIALAVDYAHRHGVIHGDLKPTNVVVDERGGPIVTDFGLTCARETREGVVPVVDRTAADELAYASPERIAASEAAIADPEALSPASDVYSLGAMLYETLSGRRPFEGDRAAVVVAIRDRTPPLLADVAPTVDPRLAAICVKALAKRREDRFASAAHFADALRGSAETVLASVDVEGAAPIFGEAPIGSTAASRRRTRLQNVLESRLFAPVAGGALAIATIAAVAIFFSFGGVNLYYSFDGPGVKAPALGDKPKSDARHPAARRGADKPVLTGAPKPGTAQKSP